MKISLNDVSFGYNGRHVLKNVNMEFETGKIYIVVGKNGSGKTTLLKVVSGLLEAEGTILIDGEPADPLMLRRNVGYVFQNPSSQIIGATVEEDVAFSLEILGIDRDEMQRRIKRVLELVGLSGLEKEDPLNLSGGQKQRLAIASMLARDTHFLAMDEPLSMLDPPSQREISKVIEDLKREGKGIIIATHELEYLEDFDVVLHMRDGTIDFCGSWEAFMDKGFEDVEVPFKWKLWKKFGKESKWEVEDADTFDER
ncbi:MULTISPECIES: energy-coupling factor ABC transporter ATP-binding protein EcfA1 [Thermotoga]|uniref:Cobalt import ATP-binding protein cbiO n=1 Tax=Thermotoga neapolitana (strain ATCC 49049 / DSM 4359 / NBRC 107923 / NS-E) TaxID=309803 RepID=B9K7G7_THENN|nr:MULTISPECIES: energy-coupling factor ABC transporter ATP-binding protein EcfA1 [Thermotoga]ACM22900.1 Putative cobalt import ATP-binding protein cbiO [Thermotoga neapolitana DSM 4359]AJG40822.1 cobalt ABC transporter [Thermotoga sp. RQ7]HBF11439.1 ABC transporter ATP-binding protein [Thermotoga neapolitana]